MVLVRIKLIECVKILLVKIGEPATVPGQKSLLQILLGTYFLMSLCHFEGSPPTSHLLQPTKLLQYMPAGKINLFYGFCINIRGSEAGSQTYLKTYWDILIFSGRGSSGMKSTRTVSCSGWVRFLCHLQQNFFQ